MCRRSCVPALIAALLALVAVPGRARAINGQVKSIGGCPAKGSDPVGRDLQNLQKGTRLFPFYLHATGKQTYSKLTVEHSLYLNDMTSIPGDSNGNPSLPSVDDINKTLDAHDAAARTPAFDHIAYLKIFAEYSGQQYVNPEVTVDPPQKASTVPSPMFILREAKVSRGKEDTADICNVPSRRKVIIHAPGVGQYGRRVWSHYRTWSDLQAIYATLENDYPHIGPGRMFGRSTPLANTDLRYIQVVQNNNESGQLAPLNTSSMAEMIGNLVYAYTRGMSDVYVWTHSNGAVHTHKAWELFLRMFDEPMPTLPDGSANTTGKTWGDYWYLQRKHNGFTDKMNVWYYHNQAAQGISSFMFFGDVRSRYAEWEISHAGRIASNRLIFPNKAFDILETLGPKAFDNGRVQIRMDFIYNFKDAMTAASGVPTGWSTVGQKMSRFGMTAANLAAQSNRSTPGKPADLYSLYANPPIGSATLVIRHDDVNGSLGLYVAEDLNAYGDNWWTKYNNAPSFEHHQIPCGVPHQQVLAPWSTTESNDQWWTGGWVLHNDKWWQRGNSWLSRDTEPWEYGWRENRWDWFLQLYPDVTTTKKGLSCHAAGMVATYCDYNKCVEDFFPEPTNHIEPCSGNSDCPSRLPTCSADPSCPADQATCCH